MNDVSITMRAKVDALERELLKMPQADIRTMHAFKPGIYERTIHIPAWTVLTGAAHKTAYRVRLEKGVIGVNTDDGVKMLTAPFEFDAPAGVKRVGRVFADDVVWTDIYENPDDCHDLAILEDRLYEVPDCGLGENRMRLARDRRDFELFLRQIGITKEVMDTIVKIESDLMPMPDGFDVELKSSKLHGTGLFVTRDFVAGEFICPGRIDGKRTPAGRFINHSTTPNAKPVKNGDNIDAIALCHISSGDEILIDYRDSMRVNFGIELQGELS